MATNLAIDDTLLDEAIRLSGLKSRGETVHLALKEFVNKRKQQEVIGFFGKMDPDPAYDYKQGRNR